jgi:GNAT superfamily N-acetyltransferase
MTPQNELIFPDYSFEGYLFSSDKRRLQPAIIHRYLDQESYWARGIPMETVHRSIEFSLCIGVYDTAGVQVGFGRMITDRATFAYLCDIFILEEHRGKGLSKEMIHAFCRMADEFGLRRFLLTTQTAHGLYRQSGFELFPYPERMMSRPGVVYTPQQ